MLPSFYFQQKNNPGVHGSGVLFICILKFVKQLEIISWSVIFLAFIFSMNSAR